MREGKRKKKEEEEEKKDEKINDGSRRSIKIKFHNERIQR